ncbi:hypothetical protein [uncultured Pseudoteredinibacter sp.]|uniref:hypothetical protein n=1 Tax=uncultured Pseudoteredinibacter sp. TaxID=1641701 RepID=UPI00260B656B|nr:hypothetical protein [uncultured Pseudoteredinibacter sp.]
MCKLAFRVGLCLLGLSLYSVNIYGQQIFSCIGKSGKKIYTDKRHLCKSSGEKAQDVIQHVELAEPNLHSKYGATISKEYRNYAFRSYEPLTGYNINIIAEKRLTTEHPELLQKAAVKLEKAVRRAFKAFPSSILGEFSDVKFYLFTGDEARTGGRHGGQWYFREGNRFSRRFDDSVVVRSVKDYIKYKSLTAAQFAVHELSHAYYSYHWKRLYRPAKKAFENAKNKKLYENVEHKSGRLVTKAYARENSHEYFAELATTYFLSNSYYPFNARDLATYDPEGYEMIENAFLNIEPN